MGTQIKIDRTLAYRLVRTLANTQNGWDDDAINMTVDLMASRWTSPEAAKAAVDHVMSTWKIGRAPWAELDAAYKIEARRTQRTARAAGGCDGTGWTQVGEPCPKCNRGTHEVFSRGPDEIDAWRHGIPGHIILRIAERTYQEEFAAAPCEPVPASLAATDERTVTFADGIQTAYAAYRSEVDASGGVPRSFDEFRGQIAIGS